MGRLRLGELAQRPTIFVVTPNRPNEPATTLAVCANVILDRDDVLLVRETKPEARGRWALPGGKLEIGESLAEGAAREALEETGLEVEVGSLVGIYHAPRTLEGTAAINFVFRSTIRNGDLSQSPEHPEARFITSDEFERLLEQGLIRGRHIPLAIEAARSATALPASLITQVEPSVPPTP